MLYSQLVIIKKGLLMFTPFTENDRAFVNRLVSKGFTSKQATDFLYDFQLEIELETEEDNDQ